MVMISEFNGKHLVSSQYYFMPEFLDICSRKWWWKVPCGDKDFKFADLADEEDEENEEFNEAMMLWLVENGEEDAADYDTDTDLHEKRISENGARGGVWCST
jgi:hypothetical protein